MKQKELQHRVATTIKRVHEVRKELIIGGGDLDLYMDVYKNGKLAISKKAECLTGNFLKALHLQMCGKNYVSMPTVNLAAPDIEVATVNNISSLASGAAGVCRATLAQSGVYADLTTGYVSIQGTQGTSLLTDGLYAYNRVSYNQIDILGTTYQAGYSADSASARMTVSITTPTHYPSEYTFSNPLIVVGTGTNVVTLQDACLHKEIQSAATTGRLTYNSMTINENTFNDTSSQIVFTRTFTNNSAAMIAISESGMYTYFGHWLDQVLIMRDLISPAMELDPGDVLTINYRLRFTFGAGVNPGGFLTNFTVLLYRHFASLARTAKDINNSDGNWNHSVGTFKVVAPGGESHVATFGGAGYVCVDPAWKQGVVIGIGDAAVTQGDFFLNSLFVLKYFSNNFL